MTSVLDYTITCTELPLASCTCDSYISNLAHFKSYPSRNLYCLCILTFLSAEGVPSYPVFQSASAAESSKILQGHSDLHRIPGYVGGHLAHNNGNLPHSHDSHCLFNELLYRGSVESALYAPHDNHQQCHRSVPKLSSEV